MSSKSPGRYVDIDPETIGSFGPDISHRDRRSRVIVQIPATGHVVRGRGPYPEVEASAALRDLPEVLSRLALVRFDSFDPFVAELVSIPDRPRAGPIEMGWVSTLVVGGRAKVSIEFERSPRTEPDPLKVLVACELARLGLGELRLDRRDEVTGTPVYSINGLIGHTRPRVDTVEGRDGRSVPTDEWFLGFDTREPTVVEIRGLPLARGAVSQHSKPGTTARELAEALLVARDAYLERFG